LFKNKSSFDILMDYSLSEHPLITELKDTRRSIFKVYGKLQGPPQWILPTLDGKEDQKILITVNETR